MAKSLSVDLRDRSPRSRTRCTQRFGVGVSSAIRWVQRVRDRGDLSPDKRGGNVRSHRIDAHRSRILAMVEAEPDLTLAEIGERLHEACGYRPDPSVVHRFFARHGITRKKRPHTPPSRSGRT